jgi:hypothetical protein
MNTPAWLLPNVVSVPRAKVRTVGEPDQRTRELARQERYRATAKYRERQQRTRERRNALSLRYYREHPERREYIARKNREYRAAKRAA